MTPRDHAAGLATALAGGLLLVLAAPVLDTTEGDHFATPDERAAYRAEVGWPAEVPIAAAWIDRNGWDSLTDSLSILERPLFVRQYWKLYPIWSTACRKLEIRLDGRLAYRTNDPARDFLAPELAERRISYFADAILKKDARAQTRRFASWVTAEARARDPGVQRVAIVLEEGTLPCEDLAPAATIVSRAPEWGVHVDREGDE